MEVKVVILILVTIFTFFGSIYTYLLFRKYSREYFRLHALFLLSLAIVFSSNTLINIFGQESENLLVTLMSYLFFPALLSISPLFYVYVKAFDYTKKGKTILDAYILNFIPSLSLLVINLFAFIAMTQIDSGSQNGVFLDNVIRYTNFISLFLVFLVQYFIYCFFAIKTYVEARSIYTPQEEGNDHKNLRTLHWIRNYILGYTIIFFMMYFFQLDMLNDYKTLMRIVFFGYILWLIIEGRKLYDQLELFSTNPYMQTDQKRLLAEKINHVMQVEKIFMDPQFNLNKFASKVGTNSKYLSKYINVEYDKNVSSFINEYRINESKKLIEDPKNAIYTMEYLAKMTGYNSKSSFYTAFKKMTGMTPTEYKSYYQNSNLSNQS